MANIKLWRTGISGLKLGNHNVWKIFKGGAQIWPVSVNPTIEFVDWDTEINVWETWTLRFRYTNATRFSVNGNPSIVNVTNTSSDEEYCYITYEWVGAWQANIQCVAWNWNNLSDARVLVTVVGEQPTNPVGYLQWPCPEWFHVPTQDEFTNLKNVLNDLWITSYGDIQSELRLPLAWYRSNKDASIVEQWVSWRYWTSTPKSWVAYFNNAYYFLFQEWEAKFGNARVKRGYSIRAFANEPVIPAGANWISTHAWIYWNFSDWLYSISSDGENWITIADKNVWASSARGVDQYDQEHCWTYFQWWNDYWFAFSWELEFVEAISVDASEFWPSNHFYGWTFYTATWSSNDNWSIPSNEDLRWFVSYSNA